MAEPSASRGNHLQGQGLHRLRGGWLPVLGGAVLWRTTGTARALGPPGASPLSAVRGERPGRAWAAATALAVSKQLLEDREPVVVAAVLFGTGAILLLPLLAAYPPTWVASPRGALVALHLGLLATALAYVLFARGLARVPVATAATISLAEPVTATLLGTAVLGERLTAAGLAGAALVLAGLAVLTREPARGASRPQE